MCQAKYMDWLMAHTLWQAIACASRAGEIIHAGRYSTRRAAKCCPPTSHTQRACKSQYTPKQCPREGREAGRYFDGHCGATWCSVV